MQMSVGEIKRSYDQAKNKKHQIDVLADLNCCSREDIEKILAVESSRIPKEEAVTCTDSLNLDGVFDILYCRLDELEGEIKLLEEEYQKVKNAIEVLGKVRSEHGECKTA